MSQRSQWLFDPLFVDTTPGASTLCPFSPPRDFGGGAGEYLSLMRLRYRDVSFKRYFRARIQAMEADDDVTVTFEGPFKTEALAVLAKISDQHNQQKRAS
ncbi:hypothetical protein IPC1147_30620 [Pseudomonas aeruginosa]|uniref:hypothetical protein n=1 Tax=Pseudomonas aeruginosa TaxID=287 RepID=UPI000E679392|nr:hypothetical protein [Pseudomonas aeruginosa]MBA5107672.1 hypothetical protein [Pseudomonas aeruginosa]MBD1300111.1 hypothetical protein [Pseudomonas aeruginosa]MBD1340676.1 hypothetical protein [Pseudomonas aeruginosa]MBG4604250.1 hypothetical protein [Pseudomonas aeruginosa]MBH3592862.1 hypothetical protein [Pseudomonas aeruginosa]